MLGIQGGGIVPKRANHKDHQNQPTSINGRRILIDVQNTDYCFDVMQQSVNSAGAVTSCSLRSHEGFFSMEPEILPKWQIPVTVGALLIQQ